MARGRWSNNDAQEYPDNVSIRDAIANGEIDVGLINHYYVAQAVAAEGPDYPVKVYFPPKGLGSLLLLTSVGVLESSDRKDEAFDFVRSPALRRGAGVLHLELEGVPARQGRRGRIRRSTVPLSDIPPSPGNLSDIGETQATIQLMQEAGAL